MPQRRFLEITFSNLDATYGNACKLDFETVNTRNLIHFGQAQNIKSQFSAGLYLELRSARRAKKDPNWQIRIEKLDITNLFVWTKVKTYECLGFRCKVKVKLL